MIIDLETLIQHCISGFENKGVEWGTPLTTLLSAEDPRLPELKKMVSGNHLLPKELLSDAKSIIVYYIPFAEGIIKSNLKGKTASEEWAMAYITTNDLIAVINDEIENHLNRSGFHVAKIKATHNFDTDTLMSRWSHRHIAWLAGLGSFGINNMLITSQGCCGRFGSLLTNAEDAVFCYGGNTEKNASASSPLAEKCLNKIDGSCGACIKKCINGAFEEGGRFNRFTCYEACLINAALYQSMGIADVCGKCLVGLPCSVKDPSIGIPVQNKTE